MVLGRMEANISCLLVSYMPLGNAGSEKNIAWPCYSSDTAFLAAVDTRSTARGSGQFNARPRISNSCCSPSCWTQVAAVA